MKDIDSRWDTEVQRARIDLSSQAAPFVRADSGDKALRDITRFAGLTSSKALRTGLPELRSAIQRKSELVQLFIAENRSNKTALQDLIKTIAELRVQLQAKKSSSAVLQALSELDETAPQYFLAWRSGAAGLTCRKPLRNWASVDTGEERKSRIEKAVQTLLGQVPGEIEHFAQLEKLSTGPRLINLTLSFNNELEGVLQEKERYRIYLVYYASALLILLMYFGIRLKMPIRLWSTGLKNAPRHCRMH